MVSWSCSLPDLQFLSKVRTWNGWPDVLIICFVMVISLKLVGRPDIWIIFTGQSNINQILILMFVFCGLITEAYYVHCLGGVDWLGCVLEEQGRQPAAGLVQHVGCTEWLCQLDPVTAGGVRELPQLKLQVSLVQNFKIQFWVITLKNLMQCTLQPSQWGWLHRDTSQSTHPTCWTQGWRRSPLTARAASSESLMLTCLRVDGLNVVYIPFADWSCFF